jgi:hypothetical protein
LKTPIQDAWLAFSRECLRADAGDVQHREMRRAFFAGAASLNFLLLRLADMPEGQVGYVLSSLELELKDSFRLIGEGRD